MLSWNMDNILSFCLHRITNGAAEGINCKIKGIKRMVCGYRDEEYFKTAIYFFCDGLDLYLKQA